MARLLRGRVLGRKSFAHSPDGFNEPRRLMLIYVRLSESVLLSSAKLLFAHANGTENHPIIRGLGCGKDSRGKTEHCPPLDGKRAAECQIRGARANLSPYIARGGAEPWSLQKLVR